MIQGRKGGLELVLQAAPCSQGEAAQPSRRLAPAAHTRSTQPARLPRLPASAHLVPVAPQAVEPRLPLHVPHHDVCVPGPRGQQRAVAAEAQRRHLLAVAAEGGQALPAVKVPQPDLQQGGSRGPAAGGGIREQQGVKGCYQAVRC